MKLKKFTSGSTTVHSNFAGLLADVKGRIQSAQTRAMRAVNAELVRLYWDIGRIIVDRQRREGWGAAVIPRLASKLRNELPELKGFSQRNIGRMIAFYQEYLDPQIFLPPAVAKLDLANPSPAVSAKQPIKTGRSSANLPQTVPNLDDSLLLSVPWAHHVILLERVSDLTIRRWYMQQTIANGWSRNILAVQIDAGAHTRYGKALSNFADQVPSPRSDLVQQLLKDPFIFDFLTLDEPFHERELEAGLVIHLQQFLLELGQGFSFVGRQYRITVGKEDFYIDLLFYHLQLRAFIVIDLKCGKFKPEHAGKLNFYCNLVNDRLKHPADSPTIGLILCQARDRLLVEYSFAGINNPLGISTYQLTRALPAQLRSALPTVAEIESELASKLKPTLKKCK